MMRFPAALPLAALCLAAAAEPAPAEAPLRLSCTPGADMRIVLSPLGGRTQIQVHFLKAPLPAAEARPDPGECAFRDRMLEPLEPSLMTLTVEAEIWAEFPATGPGVPDLGVVSKAENRDDQRLAERFLRLVRGEGCFTAGTADSGRGYFRVASVSEGC